MRSSKRAPSPFLIKYFAFLFLSCFIKQDIFTAPISQNPWFQFSHLYQQESQHYFQQNRNKNTFSFQLTYFQKKGNHSNLKHSTENIAALIFGSQTFQLIELDQGSSQNPLLFLQFSPKISLKSNGILFESLYQKNIKQSLSFFVVTKTVFYNHHISITYPNNSFDLEQTNLSNLFAVQSENEQTLFAFQLNALNKLPLTNTGPGTTFSFISFFDQTFLEPGVSMRGLLVTNAPLADTPIVIERTNATTPPQPFVYKQENPGQAPILSNTLFGSIQEGEIRRFETNTDYREFATSADLSSFWVIPTETNGVIAINAQKIQLAVQNLISDYEQSTTTILEQDSIVLGNKNNTGFAGLWIQPGISYTISKHAAQHWYALLLLPAENKVGAHQLLRIPLNNNGHTAIGIGASSIFDCTMPLQLFFDYQYFYTCKKTEKIAVPRKNSTLLIGPVLDATRSWHTVFLDTALSTYVGNKHRLFITLHYLLYNTSQEHITLKCTDTTQYNIRNKTAISQQTSHALSFDVCFTYKTDQFFISITANALKTIHAYQVVSENGWSISCNIHF